MYWMCSIWRKKLNHGCIGVRNEVKHILAYRRGGVANAYECRIRGTASAATPKSFKNSIKTHYKHTLVFNAPVIRRHKFLKSRKKGFMFMGFQYCLRWEHIAIKVGNVHLSKTEQENYWKVGKKNLAWHRKICVWSGNPFFYVLSVYLLAF